MEGIFKELRVLELANVLAGPSVGQFFAELGAEVIKIENPKSCGDVTRSWKLKNEEKESSVSAYFSSANCGKKSIALDLSNQEDLSIFYELVKISDVVIASYKSGDAQKLKVDFESLKLLNPKIIYGQITGYGEHDKRVGYDAIIQAESGFMKMNGEPGGKSLKMPVALVDVLAAHQLKEAILLAYINLLKNGVGSKVSVSLFESAVSALVNQATNYLVAKHIPTKMGTEHPNIAPYGTVLRTKNQKEILLAVGTDKQFRNLCKVLGLGNIVDDQRFKSNSERVQNREIINQYLLEKAENILAEELIHQLNSANVPAGVLKSIDEVFETKEASEMIFQEGENPHGLRHFVGEIQFMEKISHLPPPPELDADRAEILSLLR
ncbi:CaiB/BaiF CoA transferase family protein [Marivirga arenosa]|uniref:CaiB/BaiF CoA-transferase family protein n=1 Tax=Marivirga arenosa TaxID=3059076 RepID=A0AA51ZVC4_9BACT|nr:CaiB/BaiF CoA-transferase family protein [Marivirga sp. BKB1-2]WNB17426.1 CaiB/BaiF CoA-transferase family protein [Marivirga sp. BKB1-2]